MNAFDLGCAVLSAYAYREGVRPENRIEPIAGAVRLPGALGYVELITQMYFTGESLNAKDLILQRLNKSDQAKLIVDFKEVTDVPHPVGVFNIQIEKL